MLDFVVVLFAWHNLFDFRFVCVLLMFFCLDAIFSDGQEIFHAFLSRFFVLFYCCNYFLVHWAT